MNRREFLKFAGLAAGPAVLGTLPSGSISVDAFRGARRRQRPGAPITPASSTVLDELYSGHKVKAKVGQAPSGKTTVLVDGCSQPLFWANLSNCGSEYLRAGFNTAYHEFWFDKNHSLEERFPAWDRELLFLKKQGLFVIIYIHAIHAGKKPADFDTQWRGYVQAIVKRYYRITNLIGWDFCDEPADHLTYPNDAFRMYLRDKYHMIARLNRTWKSNYRDFDEITLKYQRDGLGRPESDMVTQAFPFGIGPQAFDSARFKLFRNAQANHAFVKAVREIDPDTPLWSGANNLAWAVTQVPPSWGIFFDFYPGSTGNDWETQDIWAMSIGRGPNLRPSMQMLIPDSVPGQRRRDLDPRVLRGWMVESALHGAAGITFWPWGYFPGRYHGQSRIDVCRTTIRLLTDSGIFEMLPVNTVAMLYQPYAEGWGNMSQVYGLLRYPSEEPVVLMRQLKYGTRFGQVDYLTHLRRMAAAELDQYGVILAQFTPALTAEDIVRLTRYVSNGGVLFADIGFDCLRAGEIVTAMGKESQRLFGIKSLRVSGASRGSWVATGEFGELLGGLRKDSAATDKLFQYALDVEPTTAAAALRGPGRQGLYVNRFGKGYAIYCSCLAWSRWTLADPLFRQIHTALFARRCQIARVGTDDWTRVVQEPYLAPGYEIARFSTGYALQNRTDNPMHLAVRVDGRQVAHTLAPRSVLLVRQGRPITLGTGIWPVSLGTGNK